MIICKEESFALLRPFTISRGRKTQAHVITVKISHHDNTIGNGAVGWGESIPYARYGESIESVLAQITSLPQNITRAQLQEILPAGAARNAVDCALWDLEAKQTHKRVWDLLGLPRPTPKATAYTLSLDTAQSMKEQALRHADKPVLKLKLGTKDDLNRLRAVRQGAPEARLIIDANEGWSVDDYKALIPHLKDIGIELIEQPFPAHKDDALLHIIRPIPICADESCRTSADLEKITRKYDFVNIKLDKSGGLSEAITMVEKSRKMGFGIMIGCMVGTSLAMAPATLLMSHAQFIDLDGPLLLAQDRKHPLLYNQHGIHPPSANLWG